MPPSSAQTKTPGWLAAMALLTVVLPLVGGYGQVPYSRVTVVCGLALGLWLWVRPPDPGGDLGLPTRRDLVRVLVRRHLSTALVLVATGCALVALPPPRVEADVSAAKALRDCNPRHAKVVAVVSLEVTRVRYYADDDRALSPYATGRVRSAVPSAACPALADALRGALVRVRGLDVAPTTTVQLAAEVTPVERPRNPFALSGPTEPPAARLTPRPGTVQVTAAPTALRQLLHDARGRVRSALHERPPEVSTLLRALTLGEAYALPDDARGALTNAGLAHVLAVSGLHVGLACLCLLYIVRRSLELTLGRRAFGQRLEFTRLSAGITAPAILIYALFAGGSPSALRAATMLALGLVLKSLGRPPHAYSVVALAVVLLGAIFPEQLRTASWALSIAATWAIVSAPRTGSALRDLVQITVRTTVATTPLSLLWFGVAQPVGLLSNLVLLPLYTLLVIPLAQLVSLEALVTGAVHSPLGDLFAWSASACQTCAAILAALPFAHLQLQPGPGQIVILGGCALAWLLMGRSAGLGLRLGLAAGLMVGLAACEWAPSSPKPEVRVVFFDVGQGDAALVSLPGRKHVLIDAGGQIGTSPDPGERVLLPELRALRVAALHTVIISHAHPDHYGGLRAVANELPIGQVWHNRQAEEESDGGTYVKLVDTLRARGTDILAPDVLCRRYPSVRGTHAARRPSSQSLPYRFEVVGPCPAYAPGLGLNDNSLVVRLVVGKHSFLFTGDIEHEREAAVSALRRDRLQATVIKVPHHGSDTSSTQVLVDAVQPRWAVISSGRANRFGHPSPGVVQRWRDAGAEVLRTAHLGAITFRTNGERLTVDTTLPPLRPSHLAGGR